MRAESYSITIKYIGDENGYQAKVLELPDVAEYADTYEEAYSLAIDTIETTAEIMADEGKHMPTPSAISDLTNYSGRITLRLPKTLHAYLAQVSVREDTSLNQMIGMILASYQGFDTVMHQNIDNWMPVNRHETKVKTKTKSSLRLIRCDRPHDSNSWNKMAVGER